MPVTQNTIAIVYDFDKTLSPNNMQEDTIFPAYGIDAETFWASASKLVDDRGYERTLAYLRQFLQGSPFSSNPLKRDELSELGKKIQYYAGVETFFDRINSFVQEVPEELRRWGVQVEHYIVSSGMTEIVEGTSIAKHFKKIYACEFDYEDGVAVFPKLVVSDTNKTQFLFRINKGKLELTEDINTHTEDTDRRVPFKNMVYIGDSDTDVPSMAVVKRQGGHVIAVYDPDKGVSEEVQDMVKHGRADHFAKADYTEGSLLDRILKDTLRKIMYTMAHTLSAKRSSDWVKENKSD